MKVLLEEKRKIILALLMGAALLFFAGIMYNTYDAYTKMVVEQQQQHLLLISRRWPRTWSCTYPTSCGTSAA